jgi:zinc transport system ATP-binding protein
MAETLLQAKNLEAGYGAPVVGPLSFRIDAGEVVGLWGPNGCGKSTLLKTVANTARIFAGRLDSASGLRLGWQLQQPVRLDEMPFNGWEYLRYAQAERDPPPAQLTQWLDRRVDTLSGGQFQLLAVWAVLGTGAELVLLDEPTNNLDPAGEDVLAELLQAVQGERAILLVSHERTFLDRACTRVLEIGL